MLEEHGEGAIELLKTEGGIAKEVEDQGGGLIL
jgi:hypothetical protein